MRHRSLPAASGFLLLLLLPTLLTATAAAAALPQGTPGTVASFRKISQLRGGVPIDLDIGDQFGRSVGRLGDLDGDGITELAIGAQNDDDGGTLGLDSDVGAVWILFPLASGAGKQIAKISKTHGGFTGNLDNLDTFGRSLAGIGDFDGDGIGDLVVGAPRDDDGGVNHGAIYVILLHADGSVKAHQKISATQGGFTGVLGDNDEFGRAVAPLGDLDGDGVTDLVVGAPLTNDGALYRGAIWILFLRPDMTVKAHQKIGAFDGGFGGGIGNEDFFGFALCTIGDLDGDGVQDIAVGTPKDDDGGPKTGTVWICFLDRAGMVVKEQRISPAAGGLIGVDVGDEFGTSVSTMGDLDGDGVADIAVGAILDDDGGQDRGAVYVLFLRPDGTVARQQKISDLEGSFGGLLSNDDWFGSGVSSLGDLNGDGIADLVVGARFDDDGDGNAGAIWNLLLHGAPTTPPQPAFTGAPRTGFVPLAVDFTDASGIGTNAWSWDFGDGGSSSVRHPSHLYSAPGTFTVALTAAGPGGSATLTREDYIVVTAPPPVAEFVGDPRTGNAPLAVAFTDLSTGWVSGWNWSFGDGGTSADQHPEHVFALPGTYTVTLAAMGFGVSDAVTKVGYIVVDTPPPPAVEFSGTPTSGLAPLGVSFTDLSSSHVAVWSWTFGDGGTSGDRHPFHTYALPGTFTVSLTASGLGGMGTKTKVGYIVATTPPPPTADFAGTPRSGEAPLVVAFTDLTSGQTSGWSWTFGDGATSTARHPSHTYAQPGTYTVSLTATGLGGADSETKVGYIVALVPPPPVAEFTGSPTTGLAPLKVFYTDRSTGQHTQWLWLFGDGAEAYGPNPNHIYSQPGSYTVSLTVTGLGGSDTETKAGYVVVNAPPPPSANFAASPTYGAAPLQVDFTDLSTGQIDTWGWAFGDGGTSPHRAPRHVYAAPGTYDVSLTVTNLGGADVETKSSFVVVESAGLEDPSFEDQVAGTPPALPWTIVHGSGHLIAPDGIPIDGGMPANGANWLDLSAADTNAATPPSNPGGETLPPVGGAGVEQRFLYAAGASTLRFEAAFLRQGNAADPLFNDWMSVDVTDGVRTFNLYYADTFTPTPLLSAVHGLPMTEVLRTAVDLAALFPSSSTSTVFTLTAQVGNGGDMLNHSHGYVDHFVLGTTGAAMVRNGSGVNPVVYSSTADPVLGTTWTAKLDATGHPAAGLTLIVVYDTPLDGLATPFGELLIAPPPVGNYLHAVFAPALNGVASYAIPLPDDLQLLGFVAFSQAVLLGGAGPELTNAVDLTLGL